MSSTLPGAPAEHVRADHAAGATTASPTPEPPTPAPTSPPTASGGPRARIPLPTALLAVALLVAGTITFLVLDPLLAFDDANPVLGRGRLLLYFTTQSNASATAAYVAFGIALLRGRRPGTGLELLRGLATIDMAITGIVNGLVLADPSAPWTFSEFVLHQGGPILIALWWVALPPRTPLTFAAVPLWLLHPVIWTLAAFTYRAESSDGWAPYFFLDPTKVDGWGGVAMFVGVILVVHAVLGAGAVLATRTPWARRRGLAAPR